MVRTHNRILERETTRSQTSNDTGVVSPEVHQGCRSGRLEGTFRAEGPSRTQYEHEIDCGSEGIVLRPRRNLTPRKGFVSFPQDYDSPWFLTVYGWRDMLFVYVMYNNPIIISVSLTSMSFNWLNEIVFVDDTPSRCMFESRQTYVSDMTSH